MGKFAITARVGVIVMVALFAGWLTLLAAVYVSSNGGRDMAMPSPERLAAVAGVLERTPASERPALIDALSGRNMVVQVTDAPPEPFAEPDLVRIDREQFDAIRARLQPRDVTILPRPVEGMPTGPFASPINAVQFQIGLSTGDTLLVLSRSPFVIAPIGLPVGFAAALIGIIIALFTLIVLHREFRPLSRLAVAVDKVDPTGAPVALPPIRARSPELRALVQAFERLQDRLTVLIRGRMALIGGIQHDVRTFATRLRLRIDKITDAEERDRAARDIADMIHLLDDALLASRAGASELDEELIDLVDLLTAEAADRRDQGADVTLSLPPGLDEAYVLGDRLALRRIVANLLDNAVKYGHRARMGLQVGDADLALTIDDDGPGIAEDQRALLLEPFTRVEESRARHTGGTGLGLSVARSLLDAHRGALEISEAPSGGARMIVRLPVFQAAAGVQPPGRAVGRETDPDLTRDPRDRRHSI
ncbi:MAG: ATP-binding protein [Pseudomonadota bacterium]